MPKITEFKGAAVAPLDVDVNGITVKCEVYLNAITTDFLAELNKDLDVTAGAKLVEASLKKWDMTDEKEKALPPEYQYIAQMPTDFVNNYLDGVKELKKQK